MNINNMSNSISPVDKIFIPDAYNDEILEIRTKRNIQENNILDSIPEILFEQGACHVYASRLKIAVADFDLRRLKSHACEAAHVYAFCRGWAIDVKGLRSEKDLLSSWQSRNPCEKYIIDKVDCDKLLKKHLHSENGKDYNIYGNLVSEEYVSKAIQKADAHIAENLIKWIKGIPEIDQVIDFT